MNDLIIMVAMLAVFGIWLLFHRLKNRRPADDDPGGKDFVLTKEQVEELNRQRAEKEIVLPSAPAEEKRSVSEPSAAEPVPEKLSAPAGGRAFFQNPGALIERHPQRPGKSNPGHLRRRICGTSGLPEPAIIVCRKTQLRLRRGI